MILKTKYAGGISRALTYQGCHQDQNVVAKTKLSSTLCSKHQDVDIITIADFPLELTLGIRSLLNFPSISLLGFQDLIFPLATSRANQTRFRQYLKTKLKAITAEMKTKKIFISIFFFKIRFLIRLLNIFRI